MKRSAALIIAAALCVSLLYGCGSASSSNSGAAANASANAAKASPSEAASPSEEQTNPLDLIVGKFVGVFSMSSGTEKGATFDIRKESDGTYSATEATYMLQKFNTTKPTTYSCEVTYKDGYYNIKEISNESQSSTTSSMTYYKLTLDDDVLQGDNIRYTDGSSIGKIAIKSVGGFSELEGTYAGGIADTDGSNVGLNVTIQQAANGTDEAVCSLYATDKSPDFPNCKEHCLLTYYFGHYYLLGNSWIVDPGKQTLIDFELTPSGKNLTGNMWISSEAVGSVTLAQQ